MRGDASAGLLLTLQTWESALGAAELADADQLGDSMSNKSHLFVLAVGLSVGTLVLAAFAPAWAQQAGQRRTVVSVSSAGRQGNGGSGIRGASVSGSGRFAVFASAATNLVSGSQSAYPDAFVHDSKTGITRLVSRANNGRPAFFGADQPAINGDGRFVAFETSGLKRGPVTGTSTLYLRDRQRHTTVQVSHTLSGHRCRWTSPPLEPPTSSEASISRDGSLVAFSSTCTRLNVHDTNDRSDIFVWHRHTGFISLVTRGRRDGTDPAISADGRHIVYQDGQRDAGGHVQLYLYDRTTHQNSVVTADAQGHGGNGDSRFTQISSHGKYVVFSSTASNLVAHDTNSALDVFRYNTATGAFQLASVASSGEQADAASYGGWVSGSGRYVAFTSKASDLVTPPLPVSPFFNAYVHDFRTGVTTKVSHSRSPDTGGPNSLADAISADGSMILYSSNTTTQIPNDRNGRTWDVFRYTQP
jgi:Tol biopolymer transport system component